VLHSHEARLEDQKLKSAAILAALLLANATPAFAGPEHKELSGHYYLQGVMEVGSELLLKDDGSYQWFMSYGSVDQSSKGSWTVDASGVHMTPAKPEGGRVPVKLNEAADWSDYAEYRLRQKLAKLEEAQLSSRCPSMTMGSSADAAYATDWKPDPSLSGQAAETLKPLEGLRIAAEKAAELSAEKPDDEALLAKSDAAVSAFWTGYGKMRDVHQNAGITVPDVALPQAPRACRPTMVNSDRNIPPADWVGQQGVVVLDPQLESGIPDIGIRIDYADGKMAEGRTDGRGFFVPLPQLKVDVRQVTISFNEMGLTPVTLPVSRKGRVLVMLDFDYRAAMPAFDKMDLTRAPEGLKPDGYGGGLYIRQGAK
jgi:hypothetical protein